MTSTVRAHDDLRLALLDAMAARNVTRTAMARIHGLDRSNLSRVLDGERFGSMNYLATRLTELGCDIEITVSPSNGDRGKIKVSYGDQS